MSQLVVKIEEIPEGGLAIDRALPKELLEAVFAEQREGFVLQGASPLSAKLSRVSGGVLLRGGFTVQAQAPCKRCLVDVAVPLPVDFTLNLVPEGRSRRDKADELEGDDDQGAEQAGSFSLDAVDLELFDGERIELDPIVREQVLLALPVSVVCGEDCKGLCTVCGQNLNEKECGCERKVPDPRLAALKNIKLS